jgi:hypothetical protein
MVFTGGSKEKHVYYKKEMFIPAEAIYCYSIGRGHVYGARILATRICSLTIDRLPSCQKAHLFLG